MPQLSDLTPLERELYEERAGIKEYVGNMPRQQAEKEALEEILESRKPKQLPF